MTISKKSMYFMFCFYQIYFFMCFYGVKSDSCLTNVPLITNLINTFFY